MTDGDREDDYDHDEDEDEDVPQVAALDVLLHTVKGHVRRVERAVKSAPHVHPLSKGLAFSLAFPPLGRAAGHKWSGTRARGREGGRAFL